jgi:hypothetical protein
MRRIDNLTDATAPLQVGFDITPHATDELAQRTRVVMVSEDDVTITGYLAGDADTAHTTGPLKAGIMYPMMFDRVTAVSSGSAKGYA